MYYAIRHNETGKYVSMPGMKSSYTARLDHAQRFTCMEEAQKNACGNETCVDLLKEILGQK